MRTWAARSVRPKARWILGMHNVLDESYRLHSSGFDAADLSFVFGVTASF